MKVPGFPRTGLTLGPTLWAVFLLAVPGGADAQLGFGPQLIAGSDSGLGIGARVTFPLRADYEWLDGSIDANYASPGDADSWIDTNLNVRVIFPLAEDFETMIGAGVNASFVSEDRPDEPGTATDTSFGINVLGAMQYPREGVFGGRAFPFGEVRAVLWGAEQVVFTLGLTFGGRRPPPEEVP